MRQGFPTAYAGQIIGLLGGSFDPAHEGHVMITQEALRRFGLDRVWWLVTPGNPLKAHGPAPLTQRMAAARQVMDDPRVVVTDLETRLGMRMTVDTIRALQRHYPGVRFVWLMGADNLVQFHRWEGAMEIAARVPLGVIARPGWRMPGRFSVTARKLAGARLPQSQAGLLGRMRPPAWVLVNVPMSGLSSTAIRARRKRKGTSDA